MAATVAAAAVDGDDDDEELALQQALALSLGAPQLPSPLPTTAAPPAASQPGLSAPGTAAAGQLPLLQPQAPPMPAHHAPEATSDCADGLSARAPIRAKRRRAAPGSRAVAPLTEGEVAALFFSFNERASGGISARDIDRVALAHDYCWGDDEVQDMIDFFDGTGSGKLSLEDFHKVVAISREQDNIPFDGQGLAIQSKDIDKHNASADGASTPPM
eukprot:SM000031S11526  [mRNA]  locus=s31:155768:157269:- [translate_table: standard]